MWSHVIQVSQVTLLFIESRFLFLSDLTKQNIMCILKWFALHICMQVYMCMYVYVHVYIYIYIYMYMCKYICMYVCMCMYVLMHLHM